QPAAGQLRGHDHHRRARPRRRLPHQRRHRQRDPVPRGPDPPGQAAVAQLAPSSASTARIAWPYLSSLVAPTPLTCLSSSSVDGGEAAMSRRVESWKITYGGMPSSLATDVRQARSRSNTPSASGDSSAAAGRPAAAPEPAPAPAPPPPPLLPRGARAARGPRGGTARP